MTAAATTGAIPALTGLRGYAALWVLLSHVSYTDSLSNDLATRLEWKLANGVIRHEYLAVDLFFILSGFVLTHAHAREVDRGIDRRMYLRFLLLRLARVYPLHLMALFAAWVVHEYGIPSLVEASNAASLILHVLMMASWGFCSGVSWNGPAWSLSSEWLAYLALPVIILLTASLRSVRAQLIALGAIVAVFGLVFFGFLLTPKLLLTIDITNGAGSNMRVLVGVALGSVLRRLYDDDGVRKLPWTAMFWLAVPASVACMTDLHGNRLHNSLWAYLAIMFLVFAAACAPARSLLPFTSRVPVYLGEISYAVYIFHFPVLTALRWIGGAKLQAFAKGASIAEARLAVLAAMLVVVGVAALAHHTVEKPFRRWGRHYVDRKYRLSDKGETALRASC